MYDLQLDPNEFDNLITVHGKGAIGSAPLAKVVGRLRQSLPKINADPVPGAAGSDSPLYGEGGNVTLQEAMSRGARQADGSN